MKILSKLFWVGVVVIVLTSINQVRTSPSNHNLIVKKESELRQKNIDKNNTNMIKPDSLNTTKKSKKINSDIKLVTKKDNKKAKKKEKKYSKEDLEYLTKVIHGESGYCSDEMQIGVGSVVLNRVKDDRFPNTIKEVVLQRGQYACINTKYWKEEPSDSAKKNAKFLLENGSQFPDKVIFQAMFKQGKGVYIVIENNYFCY